MVLLPGLKCHWHTLQHSQFQSLSGDSSFGQSLTWSPRHRFRKQAPAGDNDQAHSNQTFHQIRRFFRQRQSVALIGHPF